MSKPKVVTLHHHHAKPYRKRHVGLLTISVALLALVVGATIEYRYQIVTSVSGSKNFVQDLFVTGPKDYSQKVHSTYGFQVTYDQNNFYASGIDSSTGNIYIGSDLAENRAYNVLHFASSLVNTRTTQGGLILTYHNETSFAADKIPSLQSLQNLALTDGQVNPASFNNVSSDSIVIDNHSFLHTNWALKPSNSISSFIKSQVTTYVGVVSGHPVTILINLGPGASTNSVLYDAIINSLSFGSMNLAVMPQTVATAANEAAHKTLLDSLLMSNVAAAATVGGTNSEKVAALYGPAVVKIYNVYCMDINIDGKSYLKNVCNGGITGSGFFVSQDGYIATNGHVATADPKDLVIQDALTSYSKGNSDNLQYLISLTNLTQSDLDGLNGTQQEGKIIDALYALPSARFSAVNSVDNLLVGLSSKEPDVNALLDATTARKTYPVQNTMLPATLVASDYHAVDGPDWGLDAYRASDVAIIKVAGTNYPVTKLGSLSDVTQGSNLLILGFPGNATDNGLVDATNSTVTLTNGEVSAIKNAAGSNKKLIETDTVIGHGNSGGPALADNGNVVGIATYTADGSGSGDGVFNYIRDIKDLQDLATKASINFDTNSKTQAAWQAGIDDFYTAHYSKALTDFGIVKILYPLDTRVDEFIATATTRINDGEDIQDFPTLLVAISLSVIVLSVTASVILIVRHNMHHKIYKQQVGSGMIQVIEKGQPSQKVHV